MHLILPAQRQRMEAEVERSLRLFGDNTTALYDMLSHDLDVIDAKVATLLTFNALGLAILGIWLNFIAANLFHFVLDLVFLLFLFSALLCLCAARIKWADPESLDDPGQKARQFVRVKWHRTNVYRLSWWVATLGVAALLLASALHTVGTFRLMPAMAEACAPLFSEQFFSEECFGNLETLDRGAGAGSHPP